MRVLLFYSFAMHYRLGVLRRLVTYSNPEFHLISGRAPATSPESSIPEVRVEALPELTKLPTRYIAGLWWVPALRQTVSKRYDVVVMDPFVRSLTMWVTFLIRKMRRQPVVLWGLGWTKPHGMLKDRVKATLFRQADLFLTYGEESVRRAVANGVPRERIVAVGNSLEDGPAARKTATVPMPPVDPVVLGTSLRLTQRKRVDMLLEAASYLQSELGLSVEVRIVGDGPDLPRLKQMADDLGVGASFLGSLYSDASLAEFYRSIHMTVIPGHAGLTVIQSLAHGRPVVTHDNPDKHAAEWEAITPETGRFFAEGDAASLAKAIRDLTTDIEADEGRVRVACRSAYQAGWHPDRNAELIRAAILERFSS